MTLKCCSGEEIREEGEEAREEGEEEGRKGEEGKGKAPRAPESRR